MKKDPGKRMRWESVNEYRASTSLRSDIFLMMVLFSNYKIE